MERKNNSKLNKRENGLSSICFTLLLLLIMLAGLSRTLLIPKDINIYENRQSNKIENLTIEGYLTSSFQDSVENALADQIPFSQRAKSIYNKLNSKFIIRAIEREVDKHPEKYYEYGDIYLKDGYIIWKPFDYVSTRDIVNRTAMSFNDAAKKNPNVDFYIYYIETDSIIDFKNNEKLTLYEDIRNICSEVDVQRFELIDLKSYENYFFKTDHHWNYKGSYKGYLEILNQLKIEDEPLKPTYEIELNYDYVGSKAKESGLTNLSEKPTVYTFDYPEMGTRIDYEEAILGGYLDFAYEYYYGGNPSQIIYDTNQPKKENILVIGDSMDNAIIKLIASHFNRTYSVDMRYMNESEYQDFYMNTYLEENDIDKVLIVGSQVIFTSEQYILER